MHKHKIVASVGAGVIAVVAAAWLLQFEGSTESLYKRFPDVPKDVVRKVHKEMVREALAGKYKNCNLDDDDFMDDIFRIKAQRLMK